MIVQMEDLKLPRYGLYKFINESQIQNAPRHEQQMIENLSRAGQRIMGFCKSTFFNNLTIVVKKINL